MALKLWPLGIASLRKDQQHQHNRTDNINQIHIFTYEPNKLTANNHRCFLMKYVNSNSVHHDKLNLKFKYNLHRILSLPD